MAIFLHTADKSYTYDDLLTTVNESKVYYPYYQTKDLYAFFVNLIKAIVTEKPLVLIDADTVRTDLPYLDFELVNKPESVVMCSFGTIEELLDVFVKSKSTISIFTSGTTGQPKCVTHTLATLIRAVREGDDYQKHVWAYAYNPTHMAGLQVLFQALINKSALVDVFAQSRDIVYNKIEHYGVTHISATPTFYRMLMPFEKEYSLVTRVTMGGEKSNQQLHEQICKIFPNAKVNNVYASTEAGSLFSAKGDCFQIPTDIRDKFCIDDDELLIHKSLLGESDGFSYDGEFYRSGDLIEWVNKENGLFRFKSRKNELINVGGYKVNPTEVEDAINAIDGVQCSIVYGRANSILGNIVVAEVQLLSESNLTDVNIRCLLASQLQDFKIPRKIKIVNSIDLTKTGKLKRL